MFLNHHTLFFSLLFSIIGIGFYYYGKRRNIYFQIAGIVLMIYPYFISDLMWLITIGIFILLLPFFLEWFNPI